MNVKEEIAKENRAIGREMGMEMDKAIGRTEVLLHIAENMLAENYPLEAIAKVCGLSTEEISEILKDVGP